MRVQHPMAAGNRPRRNRHAGGGGAANPEQEGKSRTIWGDELVRCIWQWKDEYERRIISQLKLMGCSCDWERNRFTLDEGLARRPEMFFRLFHEGLIFRGKRLVNGTPSCRPRSLTTRGPKRP